MTAVDIPQIVLQEAGPQPTVVDGPGWIQTTPPGRGDRTYRDVGLADDRWPELEQPFTSLTAMLGRGIPSDWTGPAKWNVARYADTHWDQLSLDAIARDHGLRVQELRSQQGMTVDEACRHIRVRLLVDSASASLESAADRGSAIHRAVEALLKGCPVDRDDLRSHGALPYLLAVERFIAETNPVARLIEVVCFDREVMVAGTVDFVGTIEHPDAPNGLLVLDWKTRAGSDHDRRPKEAAQVAGYAHMLTEHYYFDERGTRRQLPVDGAAVVTFAPDGTWNIHPVKDLAAGVAHYRRAVDMARSNLVSEVYAKAIKAETPDVNALALARLADIPDGTTARAVLASTWGALGLGAASRGELTVEDWPVVDELLAAAERAHRPFPPDRTAPTRYASADERAEIADELAALPTDIRGRLTESNAPLFRRLTSGIITAEDLDDVSRLIGTVSEAVALRRAEIDNLLALLAVRSEEERDALRGALPGLAPTTEWTDVDIERVATLWSALDAGQLVVRDGRLEPSIRAMEDLAAAGKRDAVTKARPHAETFRRPKPGKWAELVADPLLFAAVLAA